MKALPTLMLFELRQMFSQRRFLFIALLLAVPPGLMALLRAYETSPPEKEAWAIIFFFLYPGSIVILLSLLYGSSLVQAELEGKTLTYMFVRPVPRWMILLGRYLGFVSGIAVLTTLSIVISVVIAKPTGAESLLPALVQASLAATLAYSAIFLALGVLNPRRALVLGIAYAMLLETLMSLMPAVINNFTVTYYVRTMIDSSMELDLPVQVSQVVGDLSVMSSWGVLLGVAAGFFALAATLVTLREYHIHEQG